MVCAESTSGDNVQAGHRADSHCSESAFEEASPGRGDHALTSVNEKHRSRGAARIAVPNDSPPIPMSSGAGKIKNTDPGWAVGELQSMVPRRPYWKSCLKWLVQFLTHCAPSSGRAFVLVVTPMNAGDRGRTDR